MDGWLGGRLKEAEGGREGKRERERGPSTERQGGREEGKEAERERLSVRRGSIVAALR